MKGKPEGVHVLKMIRSTSHKYSKEAMESIEEMYGPKSEVFTYEAKNKKHSWDRCHSSLERLKKQISNGNHVILDEMLLTKNYKILPVQGYNLYKNTGAVVVYDPIDQFYWTRFEGVSCKQKQGDCKSSKDKFYGSDYEHYAENARTSKETTPFYRFKSKSTLVQVPRTSKHGQGTIPATIIILKLDYSIKK